MGGKIIKAKSINISRSSRTKTHRNPRRPGSAEISRLFPLLQLVYRTSKALNLNRTRSTKIFYELGCSLFVLTRILNHELFASILIHFNSQDDRIELLFLLNWRSHILSLFLLSLLFLTPGLDLSLKINFTLVMTAVTPSLSLQGLVFFFFHLLKKFFVVG